MGSFVPSQGLIRRVTLDHQLTSGPGHIIHTFSKAENLAHAAVILGPTRILLQFIIEGKREWSGNSYSLKIRILISSKTR